MLSGSFTMRAFPAAETDQESKAITHKNDWFSTNFFNLQQDSKKDAKMALSR